MKRFGIAIILLALAGGAALTVVYAFSDHTRELPSCAGKSIVAFGDSLVAGYGAPDGQGFVDDLSKQIGVPIANVGVSGNTTADGLARIGDAVAGKPDIVIVLLGGNDALQNVPQAITEGNLDAILAKLAAANTKIVLVGVQGALFNDPYASMYASLAKRYGTEYVPNVLSGLLGHPDLMSDEVHPNAAGYQKVAARVLPVLLAACAK